MACVFVHGKEKDGLCCVLSSGLCYGASIAVVEENERLIRWLQVCPSCIASIALDPKLEMMMMVLCIRKQGKVYI